jgi:hypothetical protein
MIRSDFAKGQVTWFRNVYVAPRSNPYSGMDELRQIDFYQNNLRVYNARQSDGV